jgi:hypothetical protein
MKKNILLCAVGILLVSDIFCQVKIGTNPGSINPFSILELEGSNKGLLLPRVETATGLAVMYNAPKGMMVYFIPDSSIYIKREADWVKASGNWQLNGSNMYNDNTGNVGISIINPDEKLHIGTGNVKIGATVWLSAANTTLLKFGDANFITLGEEEADDKLTIRAKEIFFRPSASYNSVPISFQGTNILSHFFFGANEDTYIRAGKSAGTVNINDINTGNVNIGSGYGQIGIRGSVTMNIRHADFFSSNTVYVNDNDYTVIVDMSNTGFIGRKIVLPYASGKAGGIYNIVSINLPSINYIPANVVEGTVNGNNVGFINSGTHSNAFQSDGANWYVIVQGQ